MTPVPLTREFYARHSLAVAADLLGKVLLSELGGEKVSGRIVEVEAYRGSDDPASHAGRGRTPRNQVMFGPPGHAYVYLSYGVHRLLNAVTESEGAPGAVLIRALEPLCGIDIMVRRRRTADLHSLCSGPGKLSSALGIDLDIDGADLTSKAPVRVYDDGHPAGEYVMGPRIGITQATDLPWRYSLRDNPFVSGVRMSRRSTTSDGKKANEA